MKKTILVIIVVLLLSGCSNKKQEIIEDIKFDEVVATYTIDRNKSDCELLLYGRCDNIGEDDLENLNKLDKKVTLIGTYDKRQISYSAEIDRWEMPDSNILTNGIVLHLSIDNCKNLVNKVKIDKMIFKISNSEVEKGLEKIYINAFDSSDSSLSIMEAPIAPIGSIELNKKHTYSYKILDISGTDRDLRAKILYPEEIKKYIEIDDVIVSRDEETELQIKNEYKNQTTKVDLNKIKVYNIECTYILKEDAYFVFQPLLELQDAVESQSLVPFEAICFFNNNN
ncbi:hypothetical protein QMP26_30470 [Enterocloster clostridioformis]|uniref:hypothetical protein n=1 Tax=Enterocloster clostridioformis TaxID=1531 RepID=UPI0026767787|nr:hypothetical protein [Enterocloster clostridioformis]